MNKQLKEVDLLTHSLRNWSFADYIPREFTSTFSTAYNWNSNLKAKQIPDEYMRKTFNVQGYKFLIYENKYFLMIDPDTNKPIGSIIYTQMKSQVLKQPVMQVKYSIVNRNYRGQGLGKLMYRTFARKFRIIASDKTLTRDSFKMWAKKLPDGRGVTAIIKQGDMNIIPKGEDYDNIRKVERAWGPDRLVGIKNKNFENRLKGTSRFIYFFDKSLVPKKAKAL